MKAFEIRLISALLCLLFLPFYPSLAFAQQWNPFPGGGTFLYEYNQSGSALTWLYGTRVDSVGLAGPDSVYYFNRIDRYTFPNEIVNGCQGPTTLPQGSILIGRDNLFGHHLRFLPSGEFEFVSSAGDTFLLRTQVTPGSTWAFAPGITATLDSVVAGTVLGVPDSLMHISLSHGHVMVLSKNHGFVTVPSLLPFVSESFIPETLDFRLWGIPAISLGGQLPGVLGFFDIRPGDFIEITSQHSQAFTSNTTTITQYDYLSRNVGTNTIDFDVIEESLRSIYIQGSLYDSSYTPPAQVVQSMSLLSYDFLNGLPFETYSGNIQAGAFFAPDFNGRLTYQHIPIATYEPCVPAHIPNIFYESRSYYTDGLGKSGYESEELPVNRSEWITCYRKQADSLKPCQVLNTNVTAAGERETALQLKMSPVPATDHLHVEIDGPFRPGQLELTVLDIRGRAVHTALMRTGSLRLDLDGLAGGMYLLRLSDGKGIRAMRKFVLQR